MNQKCERQPVGWRSRFFSTTDLLTYKDFHTPPRRPTNLTYTGIADQRLVKNLASSHPHVSLTNDDHGCYRKTKPRHRR